MVGHGRPDRIAAARTYAEKADAILGQKRKRHRIVDRGLHVLDTRRRTFEVARLSAALALIEGVERDRHEAAFRQALRVVRADLPFHALAGGDQDDGGVGRSLARVRRKPEIAGDVYPAAPEGDASWLRVLFGPPYRMQAVSARPVSQPIPVPPATPVRPWLRPACRHRAWRASPHTSRTCRAAEWSEVQGPSRHATRHRRQPP